MPVLSFEDIAKDEHVTATTMFKVVEHPSEGPYKHVRPPVRFAASTDTLRHFAPRTGENTREVLEEVGLEADLVQLLVSDIPSELWRA